MKKSIWSIVVAIFLGAILAGALVGFAQEEPLLDESLPTWDITISGVDRGTWGIGLSGYAGFGISGDPYSTFGIGSIVIFREDAPSAEFGYQLSIIHPSIWETDIQFGGFAMRVMLAQGQRISPVLGFRFHQLPYGRHTRWTFGMEGGVVVEIFPRVWARLSGVCLMDMPFLPGYGHDFFGISAAGIEFAVSYYVLFGQERQSARK